MKPNVHGIHEAFREFAAEMQLRIVREVAEAYANGHRHGMEQQRKLDQIEREALADARVAR